MSETKVVTGKVRLCYVNVFQPAKFDGDDGDGKYSVCVMVDKKDAKTLGKIKTAIAAAVDEGITSKWGGKKPGNLKMPLRDGDAERAEEQPEFTGKYFFNANSRLKPGIVDRDKNEILDTTEVYSGIYGRVSVNFYPYNWNGSKGVAVGLNHVQKLADGEPLGGSRSTAEADFDDDFEDEELDDILGI